MYMMKKVVCVLLLITGLYIGTVAAIPVMPDEWYGSVFFNGNPAPAGTVIIAQVNGHAAGQLTTTKDGLFGSQFGQDGLYATTTEEELNNGTATVTFLVNGIQAFQAVPYEPGNLTKLDIYADSKAMPISPPTISPAQQGQSGTGSSQSSAGGFPVESVSAGNLVTVSPTEIASSVGTKIAIPGIPAQPDTARNSPAATATIPSSAQVPANTGSTGTLPPVVIPGIVLVIAVIIIAVAYLMRKQGKV
jgi:hypothetical protein